MLELHQFAPHWGLPNASPFCMKVETYLRLAKIDYTTIEIANPAKGPNGKAPWIIDEGKTIADSRFILDYLNDKHNHPLKGDLGPKEMALHHAMERMLEENTYWVIVYERWIAPENAAITREALFVSVPAPLRKLVFRLAQRAVRRALHAQGTGRLSRQDIIALGKKDIDALADLLGDKRCFGGDQPAQLDATAFATVAGFLKAPIHSALREYVGTKDNLVAYSQHMMTKTFPEYA